MRFVIHTLVSLVASFAAVGVLGAPNNVPPPAPSPAPLAKCPEPKLEEKSQIPLITPKLLRGCTIFSLLPYFTNCDAPSFDSLPIPSSGPSLTDPHLTLLNYATLGRGTQNYTCSGGKYVSSGAVARLVDATCFARDRQMASVLTDLALDCLGYPVAENDVKRGGIPTQIDHFFVNTPGATSGVSPIFALHNSGTDNTIYSKKSRADATKPIVDVPDLQLTSVQQGGRRLGKTAFRLATAGGQSPATCTKEGETLEVDYAAMYYFAD